MSQLNSKFVSQSELDEKRRKRQEEWEKVRKADQPVEAPEEEEIDQRSLYERLQEQKDKKQAEYEEQHKLKNQVRGLDSEEADFLEFVSQRQMELEAERLREEREALALLQMPSDKPTSSKPTNKGSSSSLAKPVIVNVGPKKPTQAEILSRIVKRKRSGSEEPSPEMKKPKDESEHEETSSSEIDLALQKNSKSDDGSVVGQMSTDVNKDNGAGLGEAAIARVIGVLPGIGSYSSSDSDTSSSESEIDTDIFQQSSSREIEKLVHAAQQH